MVAVGALGIVGVLLALQFRTQKPEYGIYIGITACLIIFAFTLTGLQDMWERMEVLRDLLAGHQTYYQLLLKAVGITYVCEFCSSICKDAGHSAIAGQIEVFGKLTVLLLGMPILLAVVENISSLAG